MPDATLSDVHPELLNLMSTMQGSPTPVPAPDAVPMALTNTQSMLSKSMNANRHPDSAITDAVLSAFQSHGQGMTPDQVPGQELIKHHATQAAFNAADEVAGPQATISLPANFQSFLTVHGSALQRLAEAYTRAHPEAASQGPGLQQDEPSIREGSGTTLGNLLQMQNLFKDLAQYGFASKDQSLQQDARSAMIASHQTQVLITQGTEGLPKDATRAYLLARRLASMDSDTLTRPYSRDLASHFKDQPPSPPLQ